MDFKIQLKYTTTKCYDATAFRDSNRYKFYDILFRCNVSFADAFNHTQQFECLEPTLKLTNQSKRKEIYSIGYQVVTKCPLTFRNPELKRKCENAVPYSVGPFVEGSDNRTYKNTDCALCNGIGQGRWWDTGLKCPKTTMTLIEKRLRNKNFSFAAEERRLIRDTCDVKLFPPNKNANVFECRMVSECKNSKHADFLKCRTYKQQLYFIFEPPTIYRNPHCARCEGAVMVFLSTEKQVKDGDDKNSLVLLFDFTKASQIFRAQKIERIQKCSRGELYDFERKSCRERKKYTFDSQRANWTCKLHNETFPNSSVVLYKNLSIFVKAHRQTYDRGNYYSYDGNITVCGNFTKEFLTEFSKVRLYSEFEFNLTVVGYTLSILALVMMLITYSLFKELRTVPGKITMSLAVAILLGQLVFLIDIFGKFSGGFCKAIALILHYFFLSAFSWMSVLAYNVARTFTYKGMGTRNKIRLRNYFSIEDEPVPFPKEV